MIYLDNAATTLQKPPQVAQAVAEAMTTLGNAARGGHGGALEASRTVHGVRRKIAALLGCHRADHVVFTSNATEALNLAIFGAIPRGSHVITTDWEHNSVLRPLYQREELGHSALSFVPADPRGRLDYAALEELVTPETGAIVCTHASNLTGDLADLARVGALARRRGLLFIVDASQTAGCLPLHMGDLGIDLLGFTGHKALLGPQGTGGLCIGPGVEVAPLKVGGTGVHSYEKAQPQEYPTRLESGTANTHGLAGLSAALDVIDQVGLETIAHREHALMTRFYQGVQGADGVTVYGDFSAPRRAPIVALNIRDYDSAAVADALAQDYDIATRPGAHCAPRLHQALGTVHQGAVRFSFSWQNTEDEVERAIAAVLALAE